MRGWSKAAGAEGCVGRWGVVTTFLRTWELPGDRQRGRLGELVRLLTGTRPPLPAAPKFFPGAGLIMWKGRGHWRGFRMFCCIGWQWWRVSRAFYSLFAPDGFTQARRELPLPRARGHLGGPQQESVSVEQRNTLLFLFTGLGSHQGDRWLGGCSWTAWVQGSVFHCGLGSLSASS